MNKTTIVIITSVIVIFCIVVFIIFTAVNKSDTVPSDRECVDDDGCPAETVCNRSTNKCTSKGKCNTYADCVVPWEECSIDGVCKLTNYCIQDTDCTSKPSYVNNGECTDDWCKCIYNTCRNVPNTTDIIYKYEIDKVSPPTKVTISIKVSDDRKSFTSVIDDQELLIWEFDFTTVKVGDFDTEITVDGSPPPNLVDSPPVFQPNYYKLSDQIKKIDPVNEGRILPVPWFTYNFDENQFSFNYVENSTIVNRILTPVSDVPP